MKTIVGIIPARGGSKTIPRKNVQPFLGKPLIAWTIECALNSQALDRVIVTTDDEEIAGIAQAYGAEVPFRRPAELAQDETPLVDVIMHAIDWLEAQQQTPDGIMVLSPNTPLRAPEDIHETVKMVREKGAQAVVSAYKPMTNPYLCGYINKFGMIFGLPVMNLKDQRHQALPKVVALNGSIHLIEPEIVKKFNALITQRTSVYTMPPERAIEIITPWDLHVAELVMRERLARQG